MANSQEILKLSIHEMNLKINNLRLQSHLPGTNELTDYVQNNLDPHKVWFNIKRCALKPPHLGS